jgi:hypothetical protein
MRRMMHAAVVFLAFSSLVHAQNNASPYNMGEQSLLIQSDEAGTPQPVPMQESPSLQIQPQIIPPNYMQAGCNRPYSQLAVVMNCNDCCPNIWENYASERAALAAKVCEHINGQCRCFSGRQCLHNQACGPCGNSCGVIGPRNRYREPFSSLYDAPSTNCGSSCLSRHSCNHGPTCTEPSCNQCDSCQGQATQWSPHPAAAARAPVPTRLATPPRNRLAEPSVDNLRATAPYYRGPETLR